MRAALWITLAALASCSGEVDEEPPLLPGTIPADCELARTTYVISGLTAPTTAADAEAMAFDLDQRNPPDNGLGNARATIAGLGASEDLSEALQNALQPGHMLWLLHIDECNDSTNVRVSMDVGIDADGDPTNNFTGAGELRVAGYPGVPAVGVVDAGTLRATLGIGATPLEVFFDVQAPSPSTVAWHEAETVSIEAAADGGGLRGRVGVAIQEDVVFSALLDPVQCTLQAIIDRSPGCPQKCEKQGAADAIHLFDANTDGVITRDELADAFFYGSLVQADLDLLAVNEGDVVYWPRHDERKDSVSLGFEFRAVPVVIVP